MQPPALVRPLRPTMLRALRVLTRLALTALVLTLTFGTAAPTEGPFPASPQLRPAPVTAGQPVTPPVVAESAPRPVDEHTRAGRLPVVPVEAPATTTGVTTASTPPAADPTPGLPGRRGPPRA